MFAWYNNAPSYLKDLIVVSQPYCGLHTTNRINRLEPPSSPKYNKMTNAFKYCAPTVWNDLHLQLDLF